MTACHHVEMFFEDREETRVFDFRYAGRFVGLLALPLSAGELFTRAVRQGARELQRPLELVVLKKGEDKA